MDENERVPRSILEEGKKFLLFFLPTKFNDVLTVETYFRLICDFKF